MIIPLVLLSAAVGLIFPSQVWAEESMVFSVNSMSEFKIGQYPFVSGMAKDNDGKPLPDVEIQANFPSRIMLATTDSAGEFLITSSVTAESGEHVITVYATKGTMNLKTQVHYQVIDNQRATTSDDSKNADPEENISKINKFDNSKYDLLSRTILDKVEEQKIENTKKEIHSEEQQIISEQRLQIREDLKTDLKSFEKKSESHTPRNAFLRFLAHIDHSVKDIFWHQFLFTEEKTEDAQIAKENALEAGKSSLEATKIFQQEAAVTQNELIKYNKELSIKFGNTTSSIQEKFD